MTTYTPQTPMRPIKNRLHHQPPLVASNDQTIFSPGEVSPKITDSSLATLVVFPSSPTTPDASSPDTQVLSESITPSPESPDDLNPVLKVKSIVDIYRLTTLHSLPHGLMANKSDDLFYEPRTFKQASKFPY